MTTDDIYTDDDRFAAIAANRHNPLDAFAARDDSYERGANAQNRGAALPGRIDDELLERLTAPIGYAHDGSDYTTTVTGPLYEKLRALRDRLDRAADSFHSATSKGEAAARDAVTAATNAILAGEPVPIVDPTSAAVLQATAAAEYGAVLHLLKAASGQYRTAAEKVAPAAREAAARRLGVERAAIREAFSVLDDAWSAHAETASLLESLNPQIDADWRGLELTGDRKRDARNGGPVPSDGATLRRLDEQAEQTAKAWEIIAGAVASNDPLRTQAYLTDDLGHGNFPKWLRRYARSVDPAWLAGIERESGLVVDLDAAPVDEVVAEISTVRTRVRKRSA